MKKIRLLRHLSKSREAVETITTLNDAPWRWEQGIQASLAMGLPAAIFTITGHQAQGMIASLGGFVSLYCADRNAKQRMFILPFVAAGLIIASAIGILSSFNEWLTIASLVLVTALSVVFTIGVQLGPPGPIMFILICAICSHLAAPVHLGGAALPGYMIISLIAEGAGIAYLVVVVLSLFIKPNAQDGGVNQAGPLSIISTLIRWRHQWRYELLFALLLQV